MAALRDILNYSQYGFGAEPGYAPEDRTNRFADMEEIFIGDPRWAQGINEQYVTRDFTGKGEGQESRHVRYLPKDGTLLGNVNRDFGAIQSTFNPHGGGAGVQHSIDFAKLPQTRFGSADRVLPVTDQMRDKLINSNAVYNDPNYGEITPGRNYRSGNEWLGPALMAATTMGMGALFGPGLATGISAARAGQGLGRGSPLSALSGLGGLFGLDPSILQGLRAAMSLSQLSRARGGGRP